MSSSDSESEAASDHSDEELSCPCLIMIQTTNETAILVPPSQPRCRPGHIIEYTPVPSYQESTCHHGCEEQLCWPGEKALSAARLEGSEGIILVF